MRKETTRPIPDFDFSPKHEDDRFAVRLELGNVFPERWYELSAILHKNKDGTTTVSQFSLTPQIPKINE